jgi:hypothetical protein
MSSVRPLKDVFTDAVGAGDAAAVAELLSAGGHADLPPELVAEAVVSFADGAPPQVAEALAPFVWAYGPVPAEDAPDVDPDGWLGLLAGADPVEEVDLGDLTADRDPTDVDLGAGAGGTAAEETGVAEETSVALEPDPGGLFDLDFGAGSGDGTAVVGKAVTDGGWLDGLVHDGGREPAEEEIGAAVPPADPSFVEGVLDVVERAAEEIDDDLTD